MDNTGLILTAATIFLILGFLFYKSMNAYTKKAFGSRWSKFWGNKLYFWQSLIFMSLAGTALIMYLLKWGNVLSFQRQESPSFIIHYQLLIINYFLSSYFLLRTSIQVFYLILINQQSADIHPAIPSEICFRHYSYTWAPSRYNR